jgi:UDP-N-acetylmuramoyl-tripeptide--D-alanyl-D-alanine ligase
VTGSFPLTAGAVATACHGRVAAGDAARRLATFSTDTRTLRPGDTFIALVGPTFDGHAFIGEAVSRGAVALVVSRPEIVAQVQRHDVTVVVVGETLAALQALARHVRRLSGARVVAITGSAGKTTTKEATAALLSSRFRTLRNRGNLNNHIGLPLSLLELQEGAEIAVVELGMNHAGEIETLVSIAEPEIRVWTNVGTAHLEFFGSMDAIAAAKAEILRQSDAGTVLVANADDPLVMNHARGFEGRTVTFGLGAGADVRALRVVDRGVDGQDAVVGTPHGSMPISLRLPGPGHLANALAAIAVAIQFAIPLETMAGELAALRPAPHRGEVIALSRGIRVLDDCYNSSPGALARTLDAVAATTVAGRRVAVLGEMLELGDLSERLHRESARRAVAAGISRIVTVGGAPARALAEEARAAGLSAEHVLHAGDSEEAARRIAGLLGEGDLVLVKGSRGTRLERVVERLRAELG